MVLSDLSLKPLPKTKTITVRFKENVLRSIMIYTEHSDVTPSRLIQRAVKRELARLARLDPKLKPKLERAMKNGNPISYRQ
jgi:hypothetical protein